MDEVRGGKMFWRQLNSRFGYGQIRILGSYKKDSNPALVVRVHANNRAGTNKKEAMGASPPNPLGI